MLLTDSPELVALAPDRVGPIPQPRTPMRTRIAAGLVALAAAFTGLPAAQPAPNTAKFLFGHDLPVRPAGVEEITSKTPRFGVEVFHHEPTKTFLAVSQTGAITVSPFEAVGADK